MPGTLYIVATPIGNLADLSPRAASTLAHVDLIACEDTRQTAKLTHHLNLSTPLFPFHDHNERERTPLLIDRLAAGQSVALVSDAGTPLISDPGYRLIDAAIAANIPVIPIPGPNAAIAALSASGLPTDAFFFGGFLPPKSTQRLATLQQLQHLPATLIFYEAPHRILDTLADIHSLLPHRNIVLARELTKLHEEFLRGPAAQLIATLSARPAIKGEFTLLIAKALNEPEPTPTTTPEQDIQSLISQGIPRMDAIKTVARQRGLHKRDLYKLLNS